MVRLGRVEQEILNVVSGAGGLIPRDELRDRVYPPASRGGSKPSAAQREHDARDRATAEAALSRSIVSLERKGLIVREHNRRTGRTMLHTPGQTRLPAWEETARAEEDLAAHCLGLARTWTLLGRRSRRRATMLRAEGSIDSTESERRQDLGAIDQLEFSSPAPDPDRR